MPNQERHVRHLIKDDGTVIVRVSNLPLGKKDKGQWVEQDGKFTAQQGVYAAGVGEALVLLPAKLNKPIQIGEFSIKPVGASAVSAKLSNSQDTILYKNVWPEVDVRYSISGRGLKEDIILKSAQSPITFVFDTSEVLDTEYAPIVHTDYKTGRVTQPPVGVDTTYLVRAVANGFDIPSPVAYDASGKTVGTTWFVSGKSISITCYPQPEHVYPITVDPVINVPSALVNNGNTTTIVVPPDATAINYAKVRFIGNTTSSPRSSSNSDSTSSPSPGESPTPPGCDMPSVSGGTTCSHSHSASASNGSIYFVSGTGPAGSGSRDNAGSLSYSGAYATGWCQTTWSWDGSGGATSSGSVSATANYTETNHASNPNVRANGANWVNPTSLSTNSPGPTNTSSIGTFNSSMTTAWFDLPGFGLKTNTLQHAAGSLGHFYEVEYSYSVSRYQMMV